MIKVGSESFRKCPCTSKLSLFLSFGVVRLSRKLFRKYGQARSHQKPLAQGNTGEGGFWGD